VPLDRSVGAALELACVLLGGLAVLRFTVVAVVGGAARGARSGAGLLVRAGRALRPGLARRLVASVVGLSTPVAAVAQPVGAAHSPAPLLAPDPAAVGASLRPAVVADPAGDGRHAYVVRAGDTLWDIARRHLPARASAEQVARAWPRWYAANRGVIGPDPSLIVPGQRLQVPGRRSAGTPTQQHAAPAPTTGTPVPSALSLDPDRR
jgi:resuscitation-promoting factor RpfA